MKGEGSPRSTRGTLLPELHLTSSSRTAGTLCWRLREHRFGRDVGDSKHPSQRLLCTTARNQLPTTHLIPYDICSLRLFVSDLDIPSIPTGTASPDLSPAHAAQQEKLRESGAQSSSLSRNSQLRQQISLHARPSAADADRQRIFQALKKPRLRSERRLLA